MQYAGGRVITNPTPQEVNMHLWHGPKRSSWVRREEPVADNDAAA